MDFWARLAEILPVNKPEPADSINYLRERIAAQSGDLRALSHTQLYKIYYAEAKQRPFLSKAFRHLAQYHLEEALVSMKLWPGALAILAPLQMKEGDLWRGIESVSSYVEKQRFWMQNVSKSEGAERLELCQQLALGASARCQLGQFAPALDWFTEALEEFKQIEPKVRAEQRDLEDSIFLGISGCLLLEDRYGDAQKFIDSVLAGEVFSEYRPRARQHLVASRDLLAGLVDVTRNFQSPPAAAELWASLMDDIQRCATPEAARETCRKIVSETKIHDFNRQIQDLAAGFENSMKRQESLFQSVQPKPPAEAPSTEEVDLSKISDPEMRQQLQKLTRVTAALRAQSQKTGKNLYEITRSMHEATQRLRKDNVARVRAMAKDVYRVPLRYRVQWLFWSTLRFLVQIVAIAYFLEEVFKTTLEEKGASLAQLLNIARRELIVPATVLLIMFALGHFAEKKIDEWILPIYKRLLRRIVANRSSRLWTTYNVLLKALAQVNQGLSDLEEQVRKPPDKQSPGVNGSKDCDEGW